MSEPPTWKQVKEVLADALELDVQGRARFLAEACDGNEALRAEVERLLPSPSVESDFLTEPLRLPVSHAALAPGDALGRFTLRRLIGEGGMGRVYEATQERPHRTVAVKVLRPLALPPGAERRFEWEAEALARLDHPAVAKVIEAGTEVDQDDTPLSWFAMELVDGRPMLAAADELGLDRAARLELFLRVCDGVAHAHRRGVIHRDLKPENILVDAEGAPHIVDFGISRAVDSRVTSMTHAGEVIGTFAYMAPEQLAGKPEEIDARADVWALGVLLYRLLTGRPPIEVEGVSLPEIVRRVTEGEVLPAGGIDRSLRGDLETILSTALAASPQDRYASVDQLASDVRRFLTDEPITARPHSALYQLGKLARRHRGLVGGLVLSLLLLVVAIVGTSLGMLRASRAQARAEVERDRALATSGLLDRMFASVTYEQDGRDVRVIDLLDSAGAELAADEGLDPSVRATLHRTLAHTYESLSLYEPAERHLALAVELLEREFGEAGKDTLEVLANRALVLFTLGESDRAAAAQASFVLRIQGLDPIPSWITIRLTELEAEACYAAGDREGYVEKLRAVCATYLASDEQAGDQAAVDSARNNLAHALLSLDESSEAEALLRQTVDSSVARLGAAHPTALTHQMNLAVSLNEMGRSFEAVVLFETLLPLGDSTWGPQHATTIKLRNNYATALGAVGRPEEAIAIFEGLLPLTIERFGLDHELTRQARNNVAVQAMELRRFGQAEQELRAALESQGRALGEEDPYELLRLEGNLVAALQGLGRLDEAEVLSQKVLVGFEGLLGPGHPRTIIARNNQAMLLIDRGRGAEAADLARSNLDLSIEHLPDYPWNTFPLRSNLGRALSAAGRHAEAVRELSAVEAVLLDDSTFPEGNLARCRELLNEARSAWRGTEEPERQGATE
jgi:tetratricopeptide (TPR) repeat protein